MLFSEFQFWIFFAVVIALYVVLPHRAQNRMLLVASCLFYAAWDWRFLGLIFLSITTDYLVALRMERTTGKGARNRLLALSMTVNLGVLGIFKYLGFFVESATVLLARMGLDVSPTTLHIILPVGISFYTFQTMSYTIDVWRRRLQPTHDYFDFALFVSFFPQLVAGPIERASNLLPEISLPRRMTAEKIGSGTVLCLTGLIKKIVIADAIAPSVDAVFSAPDPSGAEILLAVWLFAIQIYCDFSGYTDIARGVARILGFELMLNFARPYFSVNPQEFWRRWHISLSSWLRDYLYISLGGNRKGAGRTYVNLMATMTLGGLWHGAAWNFVLWGIYQGALLGIHRALTGRAPENPEPRGIFGRLMRWAWIAIFFQVVCYGWLLFRAGSLDQVISFTVKLAGIVPAQFHDLAIPTPPVPALLGIVALLAWDACAERFGSEEFYARLPLILRGGLYAGMVYLLAFGATTPSAAFIYFQF